MHAHWWDVLACAAFIIVIWSCILYGTLRGCNVAKPWPVVIGSILVNLGCVLMGVSVILKYLEGA